MPVPWPEEARDARDKWRAVLQSGRDPIAERDAASMAATAKPTFGEIADKDLEKFQWWSKVKARVDLEPRAMEELIIKGALAAVP